MNPQVITLDVGRRFIAGFLPTYFQVLGREFDRSIVATRAAFPNPVLMAFEFFSFFSALPFYPLYAVVENFGRSMLPNARFYRRYVITGEQAFKLCTEITSKVSLKAGLIDNTWQEAIIAWIAARIFRTISGGGWIARILRLVGVRTYADVFKILQNSALKALYLAILRWALVWFGIGYAMITMVALGIYWDEWFRHLQQNNPRKYGTQRNRIRVK